MLTNVTDLFPMGSFGLEKKMLKYLSVCAAVLAVAFVVTAAQAEEMAATATLPAALTAMDVDHSQTISAAEAKSIRGQGCGVCPASQLKQFAIAGQAAGVTVLLEGVFAEFQYVNADGLQVSGTFGGLQTYINTDDQGGLEIWTAGKAFQEQFEFAGEFVQQFVQEY
jgi:hypothetical protein